MKTEGCGAGGHGFVNESCDEGVENCFACLRALLGCGGVGISVTLLGEGAELFLVHFFRGAGACFEQGLHGDGFVILISDKSDICFFADVGVHRKIGEGELLSDEEESENECRHGREGETGPEKAEPRAPR